MNQDMLMESLWSEVVNPPSADASSLLSGCLPRSGDVADAGARVIASGADIVHVHQLLRDARSSAIFHAFVALEDDETVGFDDVGADPRVEPLATVAAFRARRPSPAASVAGLLSTLGATLPPEMHAMLEAQAQFAATMPDPVGDALDHATALGVDLGDLDRLRVAAARFALRGLFDRLPSLIDPLEGPHETWSNAPGSETWPPVPPTPIDGPMFVAVHGYDMVFAPHDDCVVDERGCVYELASGRPVTRCLVFANTSSVDVSPDGQWLAATNTAGRIAVCDLATGARVASLSVGGEGSGARFSPDGLALVASPWRGDGVAWRVGTWAPIEPASVASWPPVPEIDVTGWPPAMGATRPMTWSPDRSWIAWATFDAVELRDARGTLRARRKLANPTGARFSSDGRRVALGAWKHGEVWDVARLIALHGVG